MENIFEYKDVSMLKEAIEGIVNTVKEEGFVIIRGLFDRNNIREKLNNLYQYANNNNHRASAGVSPDEIRKNMSKWSIGGQSKVQASLPRFMITIYNPLFDQDIFGLHQDFDKLIEIRDALANREVQTDDMLLPNRFNGCRVQMYPAGGGFMGGHTDSRAVSNLANKESAYIQLVLLLTEKGTDFTEGGAFVMKKNKMLDSEHNGKSGDVLVYDGSTFHGVNDIDPNKEFKANQLSGRAVALATIYNYA